MAKGRPDWTSSINITGQDIAEVIERPKYGAAQDAYSDTSIGEGMTVDIALIAGTGMVYGGVMKHEGSFDPDYIELSIVIDGTSFTIFSLEDINTWMMEDKKMAPFYEKYYSEEYDKYVLGMMPGITFETSWGMSVENKYGSGATDSMKFELIYALI